MKNETSLASPLTKLPASEIAQWLKDFPQWKNSELGLAMAAELTARKTADLARFVRSVGLVNGKPARIVSVGSFGGADHFGISFREDGTYGNYLTGWVPVSMVEFPDHDKAQKLADRARI